MFVLGFTSYADMCNAPGCKAKINITTEMFPPYCSNEGVMLTANGRGITGQSSYIWTLPNGSTTTGNTFNAKVKGTYYVRYHTVPDTCGVIDSIKLDITAFPTAALGNDTFLCKDVPLKLTTGKNDDITAFYWDDGATSPSRTIEAPGKYWVEAVNHCGISSDTIIVTEKEKSPVYIGNDTLICPYTSLTLKNSLPDAGAAYKWSDGTTASSITINGPGTYWLESQNACGTIRDETIVTGKDSCICKPFYPVADAGRERWLCNYDTLMIGNSAHLDGFRYSWTGGSKEKQIVVNKPGTYVVDVSTYCGSAYDTIIVKPKIDDCECFLYIPNAFSPNENNRNDVFSAHSNCVVKGSVKIFNRWGGVVYSSDDLKKGWNGRMGNNLQPSGLYVYHIYYEYVNRPGKFFKKGTIMLVR
jgi:gliding motility-associated-like protein